MALDVIFRIAARMEARKRGIISSNNPSNSNGFIQMLAIHGSKSGLSILPSGSIEFYSPLTNLFPGNQARKSMLRDIIMDEIRPKRMYFNEIRE